LQIFLVARHDHDIGPFASQFPRDGFADTPTTAGHDGMLVVQSEVHSTSLPCQSDRGVLGRPLIVLSDGTWCKGCKCRDNASNWTTVLRHSRRPSVGRIAIVAPVRSALSDGRQFGSRGVGQ